MIDRIFETVEQGTLMAEVSDVSDFKGFSGTLL